MEKKKKKLIQQVVEKKFRFYRFFEKWRRG